MKKKSVSIVKRNLKDNKRKSAPTTVGKSTTKSKIKKPVQTPKQIGLKEKSKILLRGNPKADYVLTIVNGDWSDDIQITHEELHELYCLLERKFGEFQGFRIK